MNWQFQRKSNSCRQRQSGRFRISLISSIRDIAWKKALKKPKAASCLTVLFSGFGKIGMKWLIVRNGWKMSENHSGLENKSCQKSYSLCRYRHFNRLQQRHLVIPVQTAPHFAARTSYRGKLTPCSGAKWPRGQHLPVWHIAPLRNGSVSKSVSRSLMQYGGWGNKSTSKFFQCPGNVRPLYFAENSAVFASRGD